MRILDILEKKDAAVHTVPREATVGEIIKLLADEGIGTVLVTEQDNSLAGIISERDIVKQLAHRGALALSQKAGEIMTMRVFTCVETSRVGEILQQMSARSIRHVPVVHDGVPVGIVSTRDLLYAQRKVLIEDNKKRQQVSDLIMMSQLD